MEEIRNFHLRQSIHCSYSFWRARLACCACCGKGEAAASRVILLEYSRCTRHSVGVGAENSEESSRNQAIAYRAPSLAWFHFALDWSTRTDGTRRRRIQAWFCEHLQYQQQTETDKTKLHI